ncbi:MAG: nicotinate-nucleotide adenylyltransferase [Dehalococcoidales bacterium]|nr:nicotinate-nucleotide adenylyltransferase [Dehalococcoidales bacterium]
MRTGILGGTFDPIHNGHILVAEVVSSLINIGKVIFIPAGCPNFKEDKPVTEAKHRLQMVRLAIAEKPSFGLSTMEIDRGGVSYTVDTMRALNRRLNPEDELFLIMGWDNLRNLPLWHEPSELISLCKLAVVPRVGFPMPDLVSLESRIPGLSGRVTMLDKPEIAVTSSEIRERVRLGLSIHGLVPVAVEDYIAENGLYTSKN